MTQRTDAQKTGARGQRWVAAQIEDHPQWLARELAEDYGIDLEAELTEDGVRGEILKIQVKSSEKVERNPSSVRALIDRKYLEYAESCRYPVILVVVDLGTREAWYIWLQEWLYRHLSEHGGLDRSQASWTHWIPTTNTLSSGLDSSLKRIARWEGETQLALSLRDALRAAASVHNAEAMSAIGELVSQMAPQFADASLDIVLNEALRLGDRLRGTLEGNTVANQLFTLVRRLGGRISISAVSTMVLRGESYSRTGLIGLGILYDEYAEHMRSLNLPAAFIRSHPQVAYYCAFREFRPSDHSASPFTDPSDFIYAGLRYVRPDRFWDKYANRGPSALLDYLVPVDHPTSDGDA